MKRILTLTTALTMFGATAAYAAPMPNVLWPVPSVTSEQNVTKELRELGFDNIIDYEHSGGVIDTIATWEGEFVALRIEEDNGRITTRQTPRTERLNVEADAPDAALIEELESRGYTVVGDFQERDRFYVVEVERLNTPSYVYVDPRTGYYFDTALVDRPYMPVVADWNAEYVKVQLRDLGYDNIEIKDNSGAYVTAEATMNGKPVDISVDKYNGAIYVVS